MPGPALAPVLSHSAPAQRALGRHSLAASTARRAIQASAASRRHLLVAGGGVVAAAGGAPAAMAAAAPEPMDVKQEPAAAPAGGDVKMEEALPVPPFKPGPVPTAPLAEGLEVSRIIKGCWQLSGGHDGDRATNRTKGQAAIDDFQPFVLAGITTFDTADIYGPSEQLIGRYLASHPAEKLHVQVLTKFCCFGDSMRQATDARYVEQCIDASRQRLQVDSIDLVQFYWHDYSRKGYVEAAQNLAALQAKGKLKHVGATNFDVPRMQEMLDAGVKLVNNQVQYSLLDRRPDNGMVEFCAKHDIKLTPYGVLAGGLLTDKYLGAKVDSVKIDTYSKSKYASVLGQAGGWEWFQSLLTVLSEVGKRHGVSIADVACRWVLDRPQVAGVIIGARNANHVGDLEKVFSFQMDDADRERIGKVLAEGRQAEGDCYSWERGGKW